ncbi:hypothetical protein N3930_47330, partial [Bacillus thuringiensis]|nr:hypothetical protein [Bacillus thuringiensis]
RYGSFDGFADAIAPIQPSVENTPGEPGPSFDVEYRNPAGAELAWGTAPAQFRIDGAARELPGDRMQNPFVTVASGTD